MSKLALRPVLLVFLLALTLLGMRQVNAATIEDLAQLYTGATYSHLYEFNEDIEASLTIATVTNTKFTGVFNDGGLLFNVRGTVNRTGKVTFNGTYTVTATNTRITIRGNGNLSASGAYFIGTAKETGKRNGNRFNDSVSFIMIDASLLADAASKAGKKPAKQ